MSRNRGELDIAAKDDGSGALINNDARRRVDYQREVLNPRDELSYGCHAGAGNV